MEGAPAEHLRFAPWQQLRPLLAGHCRVLVHQCHMRRVSMPSATYCLSFWVPSFIPAVAVCRPKPPHQSLQTTPPPGPCTTPRRFVDSSTLLPNAAAPRPPHILMHEMLHVLGLTHAGRG